MSRFYNYILNNITRYVSPPYGICTDICITTLFNVSICVGARPPPPRNVSARIEGPVIRVLWLPPHTNMTLYYYIIERSADGQNWESFDERIKVPYTFFIWKDARPNMEYYFRVYSYSLAAYSIPSEVVVIRTPPAESRSQCSNALFYLKVSFCENLLLIILLDLGVVLVT